MMSYRDLEASSGVGVTSCVNLGKLFTLSYHIHKMGVIIPTILEVKRSKWKMLMLT